MPERPSLLDRNVAQWTLAYLVGAWGVLEALGFLADLFAWSPTLVRAAAVLLGAGALAVVVVAWNHGARGRQTFSRVEGVLLGLIGVAGVVAAVVVAPVASDGPAPPPQAGVAPVAGGRLAVAVLPPVDLSSEPQEAFFLAGLHDGLISQIARVSGFRVISRTSSARFSGDAVSLAQIARELGVVDIVETSVSRSADTVRMNVRLVQALPDEELVWFGEFAAPTSEVIRMHAEVAQTLARETRTDLTAEEQDRLMDAPVVDPETYGAYLRGMYAIMRGDTASIQEGIRILEEAIVRSPADPLAYAGLAMGLTTLGHSPFSRGGIWPRAQEAAERAVALAPNLAEAHAALAETKLYWERDWEGAERAFRRAEELNPSLAMNHYHYAWFLNLFDRNEEALAHHILASELDPLTAIHTSWLAELYLQLDPPRTDLALEAVEAGLAIPGGGPVPFLVQGLVYGRLGRVEESIEVLRELVDAIPAAEWTLGLSLAQAGRLEEARAVRDRIEGRNPSPFEAFGLVCLNAQLGEIDRALAWIDHRPAHGWLPWLRTLTWIPNLAGHPRFEAFLASMGLPPSRPGAGDVRAAARAGPVAAPERSRAWPTLASSAPTLRR